MRIKKGASVTGIRPEIVIAILVAQTIVESAGVELVITSGTDSKHSVTSLHYAGGAIDIRINKMDDGVPETVRGKIKAALGIDFDVILERTHIHIEHQPRRPR